MTDDRTMDLFGEPPRKNDSQPRARRTDPLTSYSATKYLNVSVLEEEVCWAISQFPKGCIYDDVIAMLPNRRVHSIQPRFAPLRRRRRILAIGLKVSTKTGRKQTVYVINEDA